MVLNNMYKLGCLANAILVKFKYHYYFLLLTFLHFYTSDLIGSLVSVKPRKHLAAPLNNKKKIRLNIFRDTETEKVFQKQITMFLK